MLAFVGSVLCLRFVVVFSASVLCLHLVLAFDGNGTFTILQKLYLPCILHLTLTRRISLTINTLLSVRYCQCYLHTTYTPHTLPHDTSMGEQYYGIGEQKSLSLRQISLRPCGVLSTAYVRIGCATEGRGV